MVYMISCCFETDQVTLARTARPVFTSCCPFDWKNNETMVKYSIGNPRTMSIHLRQFEDVSGEKQISQSGRYSVSPASSLLA